MEIHFLKLYIYIIWNFLRRLLFYPCIKAVSTKKSTIQINLDRNESKNKWKPEEQKSQKIKFRQKIKKLAKRAKIEP